MKLALASEPWYVIASKPNQETIAVQKLEAAGFHVYLPFYQLDIVNRRTHTWRRVAKPRFPGYMFVAVPKGNFKDARECDGVGWFLGVRGCPARISGDFVVAVQVAEMEGEFDDLHVPESPVVTNKDKREKAAKQFQKGQEVSVKSGPFEAFYAVVDEVTRKGNIRVSFQLFGGEQTAEFEAEHLSAA